ncbi:hypothetical protein IFM89_009490 [Coptis chinensis]|uniref:Uncharacterized protein n=1 Tax=Coptis chinensis TaxID=261450 RepID=A0A835HZ53_9MAGN|nr:hypothetical protein IFM89_009490 [Coptis chinensis]
MLTCHKVPILFAPSITPNPFVSCIQNTLLLKHKNLILVVFLRQVQQQLSLGLGDERKFSEILYQSLLQSTTSPLVPSLQSNYINSNLLNSALSLDPLLPLPNLPSTSLSAFNNPTSMSSPFNAGFQSPNVLNYSGEAKCSEDFSTSATITPMPVQLQIPSTNSEVDSSSYWNWDDLNILI